jgi:hypothetical protein
MGGDGKARPLSEVGEDQVGIHSIGISSNMHGCHGSDARKDNRDRWGHSTRVCVTQCATVLVLYMAEALHLNISLGKCIRTSVYLRQPATSVPNSTPGHGVLCQVLVRWPQVVAV